MPAQHEKVLNLNQLAERLASREPGQRVVLCHGDFEVLHPGYILYLEEAKRMGDVLVVCPTPDPPVSHAFTYPHFDEPMRAQSLAALAVVDFVVADAPENAAGAIRQLRPTIFVRGQGEDPGLLEGQALKEVGAELAFAPSPVPVLSYQNPLSAYPKEVSEFLKAFSARYSANSIQQWLVKGRSLKVLVVGEAIVDEYHYVESIGKSGKEPILATRYLRSENFAGGILAVANNVAAFADQVDMLTVLGRQNGQADPTELFIRQSLKHQVRPIFLYQDDAPTIVKRRFVESYPLQKLFEVYHLKHIEEQSPVADELCAKLDAIVDGYDVVIVADYGHGMIVPRAVDILCAKAKYLAVNTQTNADNQGFNTISKYRRADFVSLSEKEIRLEVRSRQRETASIMEEVGRKMGCQALLVTSGQRGNQLFSPKDGFSRSPSLSSQILDRVGAGDAVFSATSLCVAQGAPLEVVGFIGNIVGAHAVATVGHRDSLDVGLLGQHISSLLDQGGVS